MKDFLFGAAMTMLGLIISILLPILGVTLGSMVAETIGAMWPIFVGLGLGILTAYGVLGGLGFTTIKRVR